MGCAGCLVVQTCLATLFLQTDQKFGTIFSTFWGWPWSVVKRRLWRFQMSFCTKVIVHPLLGPKNPFQKQFVEKKGYTKSTCRNQNGGGSMPHKLLYKHGGSDLLQNGFGLFFQKLWKHYTLTGLTLKNIVFYKTYGVTTKYAFASPWLFCTKTIGKKWFVQGICHPCFVEEISRGMKIKWWFSRKR